MNENIDNLALELANKSLERNFDPEAYIVKYIAEKNIAKNGGNIVNLVSESNVDECIQIMLKLFVVYYNDRTVNNLQSLLATLEQVIVELYNTCETDAERTVIIQSIDKLHGL